MTDGVCAHFVVSGRVQGVAFRAATRAAARGLGLRGWVRNRPDGDVELIACGDGAAIDELERWLWQGPPAARVTQVTRTLHAASDIPASFEVVY